MKDSVKMLNLDNIVLSRGNTKILDGLNATALKGTLTILTGGNGTGKTTLLSGIAGMLELDSGVISSNDCKIVPKSPEWSMKLSYTLDDGGTIPLLTIEEQLRLQCLLCDVKKEESELRAAEVISILNLFEHRNHRAEELSAGLRKKLGIGLGLIRDADIYLFDEPFSSLDVQAAAALNTLLGILKQRGRTIILSTHTPSLVTDLCDGIWYLSEGKIKEYRDPKEMQQFFINSANVSSSLIGPGQKHSHELSWIGNPL